MLVPRAYPLLILKGEAMKTLLAILKIPKCRLSARSQNKVCVKNHNIQICLILIFTILVFGKYQDGTTFTNVKYDVDSSIFDGSGEHLVYDLAWKSGEKYNVKCDGVQINESPIIPDQEYGSVSFTSEHGGDFEIEQTTCDNDNTPPMAPIAPTVRP